MASDNPSSFPLRHRAYPCIAAVAIVVMLVRSGLTTREFNHTYDEQYHIGAAVALYDAHKHVVDITHPPLAWLVAGLPLRVMGVHLPELKHSTTALDFTDSADKGAEVLFDHPDIGYWRIITAARLAMLLFPALAMFYLYLLARWLGNDLVAMLAVLFCSTDPTLLAHSAMVNNDVAVVAGFVASLYYGLRLLDAPTILRAAAAGLAFGLAVGAKFTALLLLPSLGLLLLVYPLVFSDGEYSRGIRSYFRGWPRFSHFVVFGLIAFMGLWSTYLFNAGRMEDQQFFDYTPKWQRIDVRVREAVVPMPSFGLGMIFQSLHSKAGHMAYLDGEVSQTGWWNYFPEAVYYKEPTAFLIALLAAVMAMLVIPHRSAWPTVAMAVPVGVYLAVAMAGNVMIGIRHLLPILPLCYFFIAWQLGRGKGVYLLIALILGSYAETAMQHPNYIAFFSYASGGPQTGDKHLLDSNLDWGQDVWRASQWLKANGHDRAYSTRLYGLGATRMLKEFGLDPAAQTAPPHGLFLISKSTQHGYDEDGLVVSVYKPRPNWEWLRRLRPVATIGDSIDVYDLDKVPTTGPSTRPATTTTGLVPAKVGG